MAIIGRRIKHARKKKKYSQAQLADLVGVSQPTVGNWESGNHIPRLNTMSSIADALEVRRLWLISGTEHTAGGPQSSDNSTYLSTPLVHVPVHAWPRHADELTHNQKTALHHVPISLWALEPFALKIVDKAMAREFLEGTIVIFDAALTDLHDGRLYLFNWNGSVILRRWRDNPSRLEPAASPGQFETLFPDGEPVVIASALQSIRDLWEPLPK